MLSRLGRLALGHINLKSAAGHTERLHARRDVLCQSAPCCHAASRKLLGLLAITIECRREILTEDRQIGLSALNGLELLGQLRRALGQLISRNAVLPRQLLNRGESTFNLILPTGIDFQTIAIVFQLACRFTDLDGGGINEREHRAELVIDFGEAL